MNTKEKQNFHIVLASSNSFFNLWVKGFISPSRHMVFVLGHLDENESERYWEELLPQVDIGHAASLNYMKVSECMVEASF